MSITEHVDISITSDSLGATRQGFGTMLMLSYNASAFGVSEMTRSYRGLAEMVADGFTSTTPEYKAAQAFFAQQPHPSLLKVGKGSLPPTKRYTCSVAAVRNSHTYRLRVTGESFTAQDVTFTSDSSATDGEIVAGLVAALNALTGENYTAAGSSSPFTITGNAAGDWFTVEVYDPADLSLAENHADPGVATDLAAIEQYDSDWYGLHTMYNSDAYVKAAAAWVESAGFKIYLFDVNETEALTTASNGTNGTLDDIKALAYKRSAGAWHHAPEEMAAAAWYAALLSADPGSRVAAYLSLTGVTPSSRLTTTQRGRLDARNASYYKTEAALPFTWKGKRADGDWIDVTIGDDWVTDEMGKSILEALVNATDKIPYTDEGVAIIAGVMRGVLRRAVQRQIYASFEIQVPKVADISSANKAARLLPDMKFSAVRSGAILSVEVTGVVSI